MTRVLIICLAGALGTAARYGVSLAAPRWLGVGFPWGTLIVNVVGSFLLSGIMWLGIHGLASPTVRLALGTGFCGGFTTYSTFNYETLRLFQERAFLLGAMNLLGTLLACAVGGVLGWVGASLVFGD
jgi:fluoride exporter